MLLFISVYYFSTNTFIATCIELYVAHLLCVHISYRTVLHLLKIHYHVYAACMVFLLSITYVFDWFEATAAGSKMCAGIFVRDLVPSILQRSR